MRWRQPAHSPLVEAIVASFGESASWSQAEFAKYTAAQWRKNWFWLDASGLPLYFLNHAEQAGLIPSIDPATIERLRCKREANRERSIGLLRDFVSLNREFAEAGVVYANLKGFTLCPHSCPSPELRLQLDFDFLVAPADVSTARDVLERRGFTLSAATSSTLEFKAEHNAGADLSDPYRNTAYRSVELHLHLHGVDSDPSITSELLSRRLDIPCLGARVPALSPADQFVSQALHILGHLRSATTRPAWLLEFQNHLNARASDTDFWFEVQQLAQRTPLIPIAIGASALLARDLFGAETPSNSTDWAESSLPSGVRSWLAHYGRRAVLADFPGTKLHLLLERELVLAKVLPAAHRVPSALPALRLPRVFRGQPDETPLIRFRRCWFETRYVLFRLRFHVSQGLLYVLESYRRSRRVDSMHSLQTLTKRKQLRDNSHVPAP